MIQLPSTEQESRRLAMLRSLGIATEVQDSSLVALAKLAADMADSSIALVSLMESHRLSVVGAVNFDEPTICRWDSFCNHALADPDRVLWVPDALLDARFLKNRFVAGPPHIRFYAGAPLSVNGCVVGTLCVLDARPRAFEPSLARRLRRLGDACAAELAERHRTNAMRQALDASADALVDCDADGRVISWSPGAEALFGIPSRDALGADVTMIIPPEHRDGHREGMRRWRESGAARIGRRLELPAMRNDGSSLDIELWMSVSYENCEPQVHANIRDISERRSQARQLDAAKAKAEDASRAKTAFLANMSHELRTPLNGVTACAGLLASADLSDEHRKLVAIIGEAAGQLERLIGDVLDVARIDSGEVNLEPVPTDLGQLVDRVGRLCQLKARENGLSLIVDSSAAAGATVVVDADRLKQVLGNLLSNAVKFTPAGEIGLAVSRAGDRFTFEVSDTGIGFSELDRDRIFERFQQADPSITRRFGGTGLGLSICRDLVNAMGGTLHCRSRPGEGSSFWFELELPCVVAEEGGTEPVGPSSPAAASGLRVLVTDDHETNRQVAALILEAAGARVAFAENGQEALALLSQQPFDLVLMDMMMPVMEGLEATRRLRGGEAGAQAAALPVVVLTANTLPEHIAQAHAAGADLHVPKPISPQALLTVIEQVTVAERVDEAAEEAA